MCDKPKGWLEHFGVAEGQEPTWLVLSSAGSRTLTSYPECSSIVAEQLRNVSLTDFYRRHDHGHTRDALSYFAIE